ncbi:MAG TPA: protease inhibitor I42 family protein [Candidatus Bathyarchaeia archaeon]|nr:protease inhibitor I42 family protein [Candidatus Bathyarchaeia archaeon]
MEKKTYIVGGVIIAILLIVVVLMAYSPSEVQLTAADNGSTVELESGQVLSITLNANPTTGYTWEVVDAPGEQVMRQVGEIEFIPNRQESGIVGSGGVQIIRFECVNAGQTVLKLVYHRPWETDVEPLETFSIHVAAR